MSPRIPPEVVNLVTGDSIPSNSVKTYSPLFPLGGEGYDKLRLTFYHTVVIGTGTTPISLSEYNIVKNINFRTDRNETPINTPAVGLYYFNHIFNSVKPVKDDMAAADGVYKAIVDIPFAFPFLSRKEDTILDTGRYDSLEMEINLGGIADLFGTPGTATVATTMDMTLFRTKETREEGGKPHVLPYIKHLAPFDPTARAYIDIESAKDLNLLGLFAVAHDGATAGVAFTGTPADILDKVTFRDNYMDFLKTINVNVFAEERNQYSLSNLTGVYPYVFTREGSYMSAYWTGDKSEIKFEIGAVIGSPTNPQVDMMLVGIRDLK